VSRRIALVALLAVGLTGCGYSLEGRGISTDPSVKRIGVPLFRDTTGRVDLDNQVPAAVIEELLKRGRFTVVKETTGVDAVVIGEILAYEVEPINFTADGQVTEATRYAISLTAKVTYRKVGQTEPLWENNRFSFRDEYDLSDADTQNFFDREEQSIERLSEQFAHSLVATMLEAF
jgi:hypothetical protein